jgi:hypothetical protein
MSAEASEKLFAIMETLRHAQIFHRLHLHREDAVCVEVCVPGQIWEIDVHRDGHVEIEVFRSSGTLLPEDALPKMIQEFADYDTLTLVSHYFSLKRR